MHLFWMSSKQVFPLGRKWFNSEPRHVRRLVQLELRSGGHAGLAAPLCDADGRDLPVPTLVSPGHRTDVGDYREGLGEAVGPSICGSNLLWGLNLRWEVLGNKPQWACRSGCKTNIPPVSLDWRKNRPSSSTNPAEQRSEEPLIPQILIQILNCELISEVLTHQSSILWFHVNHWETVGRVLEAWWPTPGLASGSLL